MRLLPCSVGRRTSSTDQSKCPSVSVCLRGVSSVHRRLAQPLKRLQFGCIFVRLWCFTNKVLQLVSIFWLLTHICSVESMFT